MLICLIVFFRKGEVDMGVLCDSNFLLRSGYGGVRRCIGLELVYFFKGKLRYREEFI